MEHSVKHTNRPKKSKYNVKQIEIIYKEHINETLFQAFRMIKKSAVNGCQTNKKYF